jgi:hypothetical protein
LSSHPHALTHTLSHAHLLMHTFSCALFSRFLIHACTHLSQISFHPHGFLPTRAHLHTSQRHFLTHTLSHARFLIHAHNHTLSHARFHSLCFFYPHALTHTLSRAPLSYAHAISHILPSQMFSHICFHVQKSYRTDNN